MKSSKLFPTTPDILEVMTHNYCNLFQSLIGCSVFELEEMGHVVVSGLETGAVGRLLKLKR